VRSGSLLLSGVLLMGGCTARPAAPATSSVAAVQAVPAFKATSAPVDRSPAEALVAARLPGRAA
jgi:hypothetical protein